MCVIYNDFYLFSSLPNWTLHTDRFIFFPPLSLAVYLGSALHALRCLQSYTGYTRSAPCGINSFHYASPEITAQINASNMHISEISE